VSGPSADPVREVRRIVLVVLVAVAAAAVAALLLGLRDPEGGRPAGAASDRPEVPATFREAGFVDGSVRLVAASGAASDAVRLGHVFSAAGAVWLVARCDRGTVTVRTGAVTSSRPCIGRPVGVTALAVGDAGGAGQLDVVATVSGAQRSAWGVALYR
jgi:hypothetical protein